MIRAPLHAGPFHIYSAVEPLWVVSLLGLLWISLDLLQTQADQKRLVDSLHHLVIEVRHSLPQPSLVYGADLLQQYNGIHLETTVIDTDLDVRGELGSLDARCDGCNYRGWAVVVAYVVLHNQDGASSPLLRANDRVEVGVVDIPSLNHSCHSPPEAARSDTDMLRRLPALLRTVGG